MNKEDVRPKGERVIPAGPCKVIRDVVDWELEAIGSRDALTQIPDGDERLRAVACI